MENINALEQIMLFLSQQGPAMVITGVVIYCVIRVADIGLIYLKDKAKISPPEKRSDVSLKVQLIIDRLIIDTNANRILIFEFHNGASNLHSLPFIYMTCNYETSKRDIVSMGQSLKAIPITLYTHLFDNLQKNPYVILDIENPNYEITKSGYDLLTFQDEKKAIFILLRDVKYKTLGFIAIYKNDNFSDKDIEVAKDISGRLGSLLSS
ncbi:MAG: hypothetical protein LBQ68_00790 [Clostridiales bacterium]|jgi:hypothetical protein|nr:hypothetical protein [Clostridiales bacterium]